MVLAQALRMQAVEVVPAEVVILCAVGQHVVRGDEDGVSHRNDRPLN